jgi:hypothetical protein
MLIHTPQQVKKLKTPKSSVRGRAMCGVFHRNKVSCCWSIALWLYLWVNFSYLHRLLVLLLLLL